MLELEIGVFRRNLHFDNESVDLVDDYYES